MDYLKGQDLRKVYPLYHAPLISTFAGVIDIFELNQLEKIKVETQQSQGGLYVEIVQLYDRGRDLSRADASQDRDEVVVEWLAFSNAVRQITFWLTQNPGCNTYSWGISISILRRRIISRSTIYDQAISAVIKMLETAGTDWHQP